jgi:hypothetical protein
VEIEKESVLDLITIRDFSSIEAIAFELDIEEDEVRHIIMDLQRNGRLHGHFSGDWKRFYREEPKTSDKPIMPTPEIAATQQSSKGVSQRQIIELIELFFSIAILLTVFVVGGLLGNPIVGPIFLALVIIGFLVICYRKK